VNTLRFRSMARVLFIWSWRRVLDYLTIAIMGGGGEHLAYWPFYRKASFIKMLVSVQIFVDDLCIAMSGSMVDRNSMVGLIIISRRAPVFPVSFENAKRGPSIAWIGAIISIHDHGIEARVNQTILLGVFEQGIQDARSFGGRANHVATLLWTWRPFLQCLWGAPSAPLIVCGPSASCFPLSD
jgi:hypothetical protein